MAAKKQLISNQQLGQAILFMAVVSFFLGKAALNGEEQQQQPKKAA